jgi:DNA polymerase-3 subunit beta
MPAAFEGEELEIGFNPEFLKEGIESVAGDEILLRLISPLRPGLLEPVEGDEFRYLVMPIRLNV